MNNAVVRLLLEKLNMGETRFRLPKMSDDGNGLPFDVLFELKELASKGYIRQEGEGIFLITVDIGTMRKYVLEKERAVPEEDVGPNSAELDCNEIMQSVWRLKSVGGLPIVPEDDGDDDDDEDDEPDSDEVDRQEIMRRRREFLEKRRRELMELIHRDVDDEDDKDDDDKDDEDGDEDNGDEDDNDGDGDNGEEDDNGGEDVNSPSEVSDGLDDGGAEEHSDEDEISEERERHDNLVALLSDNGKRAFLAAEALKICAGEGYITARMLSKKLGISEDLADSVCLWLYLADFTDNAKDDERKYILTISQSLFSSCCTEAEERKAALSRLSAVMAQLSAKKQAEEKSSAGGTAADSRKLKNAVKEKLLSLINSDGAITRAKAITKAQGCMLAAGEMANEAARKVYEQVVYSLNNMSDYVFNRLKKQAKG